MQPYILSPPLPSQAKPTVLGGQSKALMENGEGVFEGAPASRLTRTSVTAIAGKPGAATAGNPSKHLRLRDIAPHFHLGLKQAAANLGICASTLKRACRRHKIERWPRRLLTPRDQDVSDGVYEDTSASTATTSGTDIEAFHCGTPSLASRALPATQVAALPCLYQGWPMGSFGVPTSTAALQSNDWPRPTVLPHLQVLYGGDLLGTLPLMPSVAAVGCSSLQHSSPFARKPACSWQSAMHHCWQALRLAGLGAGDAAMASVDELRVPAVWTSSGILTSREAAAGASSSVGVSLGIPVLTADSSLEDVFGDDLEIDVYLLDPNVVEVLLADSGDSSHSC